MFRDDLCADVSFISCLPRLIVLEAEAESEAEAEAETEEEEEMLTTVVAEAVGTGVVESVEESLSG